MKIEFNQEKFRELMLLVAKLSEGDPRFGATKLNKLLFYMDFGSHHLLGKPITGATYQHLPAGPAPRELLPVREFMIDTGALSIEQRPYFTGTQERLVPGREPDTSLFEPAELSIIKDVVDEFWGFNARRISEYSHQEWAWQVTKDFDDMPYYLAWVSTDPLTPEEIQTGLEVAAANELLDP